MFAPTISPEATALPESQSLHFSLQQPRHFSLASVRVSPLQPLPLEPLPLPLHGTLFQSLPSHPCAHHEHLSSSSPQWGFPSPLPPTPLLAASFRYFHRDAQQGCDRHGRGTPQLPVVSSFPPSFFSFFLAGFRVSSLFELAFSACACACMNAYTHTHTHTRTHTHTHTQLKQGVASQPLFLRAKRRRQAPKRAGGAKAPQISHHPLANRSIILPVPSLYLRPFLQVSNVPASPCCLSLNP